MKLSKIFAGMSAMALVASMATMITASADSNVVWTGSEDLAGWSNDFELSAATVGTLEVGDILTVTYEVNGAEPKIQFNYKDSDWTWTTVTADEDLLVDVDSDTVKFEIDEDFDLGYQSIIFKGQDATITSVAVGAEDETPVEETTPIFSWTVDANGKPAPANWEFNPVEYLTTEQLAEVDSVDAYLTGEAFFNGTIGGNTVNANDWTNAGQIDVAEAGETVWTLEDIGGLLVGDDGTASLQIQLWWMNAVGSEDEGFTPAKTTLDKVEFVNADGEVIYTYTSESKPLQPKDPSSNDSSEESSSEASSSETSSEASSSETSSETSSTTKATTTTKSNSSSSQAGKSGDKNPSTGAAALATVGVVLAGAAVVASKKK